MLGRFNIFQLKFTIHLHSNFSVATSGRTVVSPGDAEMLMQPILHNAVSSFSMVPCFNMETETRKKFSQKNVMNCCKVSAGSCRKICFHCSAFMEIAFPRIQRRISDDHKFSRAKHRKEPAGVSTALQLNHRHLSSFVVIEIVMIKK